MGLTVYKPIACALRQKSDSPQSRAALFDPPTNPGGDRCGIAHSHLKIWR